MVLCSASGPTSLVYDEICFKELAYMVMEAEKSKLCSLQALDVRRPGMPMVQFQSQPQSLRSRGTKGVQVPVQVPVRRQEKTDVPSKSQSHRESKFFLPPFYLFRPSTDWMGLQLIGWAVCFTQSADSNANLTQKHPHRYIQNLV